MAYLGERFGGIILADAKYLEWHGQQYRVVVVVPRKLQEIIGKTRFKHALGTSDLKIANEMKWAVIARFKDIIAQARRAPTVSSPQEAAALKARLKQADEHMQYWLHEEATRIEASQGFEAANSFYELASGKTTPLNLHQDAFLAFKADYRLKTQGDFKRVLGWLDDWLRQTKYSVVLEKVSRKVAGQFIEQHLCVGRSRAKASAYLGFLREYWKWLVQRGHCEDNPWLGQSLPAAPRRPQNAILDGGKRAYTDEEFVTLLYGPVDEVMQPPPSLYLTDLMKIAALSGMRIEEVCQLKLRDCTGDTFEVLEGKTKNAKRSIPIHPDLIDVVERLSLGRKPDAFLIEGLPHIPTSREGRSDPASKAFSRYRVKMGIDERPNGKAKSNVDFHSFRRWFIRKARDAMLEPHAAFGPWTLADVVGHHDEDFKRLFSLTMRHYPGASSDEAKRALVNAIVLPVNPSS
jgi:integrase